MNIYDNEMVRYYALDRRSRAERQTVSRLGGGYNQYAAIVELLGRTRQSSVTSEATFTVVESPNK